MPYYKAFIEVELEAEDEEEAAVILESVFTNISDYAATPINKADIIEVIEISAEGDDDLGVS